MQLISQGDIVLRALFVFLVVMLFASVYLFLIKAVNLSCRAHRARKFRCDLANACSSHHGREKGIGCEGR
jgi:biopolymer transport protein ExbB/TolQ